MILKQRIAIAIVAISFILAAGLIETRPIISVLLILVMGGAVIIGGLDRKKTSYKMIIRERDR